MVACCLLLLFVTSLLWVVSQKSDPPNFFSLFPLLSGPHTPSSFHLSTVSTSTHHQQLTNPLTLTPCTYRWVAVYYQSKLAISWSSSPPPSLSCLVLLLPLLHNACHRILLCGHHQASKVSFLQNRKRKKVVLISIWRKCSICKSLHSIDVVIMSRIINRLSLFHVFAHMRSWCHWDALSSLRNSGHEIYVYLASLIRWQEYGICEVECISFHFESTRGTYSQLIQMIMLSPFPLRL